MQENLLGLVEQAGVVGAGGAGFPTHVKLKAQADTVIINGAECEPLLRVDQQLMALQAGDLDGERAGGRGGRGGGCRRGFNDWLFRFLVPDDFN